MDDIWEENERGQSSNSVLIGTWMAHNLSVVVDLKWTQIRHLLSQLWSVEIAFDIHLDR